MTKTRTRILSQIAKHDGVTSVGLVAADLGLTARTVHDHVRALTADGKVERGWDGSALCTTATYRTERAADEQADRLLAR